MKILLIGKYPPMQGGISAKTYWLFRELEKHGFDLRAVTVEARDYSIKGDRCNRSKTESIRIKEPPWHIPESELLSDRIFQSSMEIIEDFKPDLIETNYLWPFCLPALLVANITEKPLIIRHAGSDIQKFYQDEEFKKNIKTYFKNAAIVVTNHNANALVRKLCDYSDKVQCMRRYVPNPDLFRAEPYEKQFDILFTGKINYYWNLRGINLLIDLIKHRDLKSLFIMDGKYKKQVTELIEHTKTRAQIRVKGFVSPETMPKMYNSCKWVWCWDEKGSVEDFSNTIWEALYCGVPCIINAEMANRITYECIPNGLTQFIHKTTAKQLKNIDLRNANIIDVNELETEKMTLYEDYINSNKTLYKTFDNVSP